MAKKPNGFVIYRGPSLLDGAPIAVVAITKTTNVKTGDMVQTYIMRTDVDPVSAVKSGADSAVCGNCKHRPSQGGACYVRVFQGPLSVYRALQRGVYPDATPDHVGALIAGRALRLGSYGDPMAVPFRVWLAMTAHTSNHTGYTHQWANPEIGIAQWTEVTTLCMASVDSESEAAQARKQGLRYFRVRTADESVNAGEFMCPASDEAGKRRTCATCGACSGSGITPSAKASPVIIVHGGLASRLAKQRAASGSAFA